MRDEALRLDQGVAGVERALGRGEGRVRTVLMRLADLGREDL